MGGICTQTTGSVGRDQFGRAYLGLLGLLHDLVLREAARNESVHFSSAVSPVLTQLLQIRERDVVALAEGEGLTANAGITNV